MPTSNERKMLSSNEALKELILYSAATRQSRRQHVKLELIHCLDLLSLEALCDLL